MNLNHPRRLKRILRLRSLSYSAIPVGAGLVILAIALGSALFFSLPQHTVAQPVAQTAQQVSFRISRLETEVRSLRSQINQLETQLGRLGRDSTSRTSTPAPSETIEPSPTESSLMFDQLATLVIETRQDVFALQEQVEAIEEQIASHQSRSQEAQET